MATPYHLRNIYTLLARGFTAEELRRLGQFDEPDFKPVFDRLPPGANPHKIAIQLVEYARPKSKIELLLAWAKKHNPAGYQK